MVNGNYYEAKCKTHLTDFEELNVNIKYSTKSQFIKTEIDDDNFSWKIHQQSNESLISSMD